MKAQFKITWVDSGREPQCIPDLRYPDGIDLDVTNGKKGCIVKLPYPAKRCGHYHIGCLKCGVSVFVTTAGRIDDPRSIKIPCDKI